VAGGFLAKAEESLAPAEADYGARRYNSCARSAYYAAFQAAVAALQAESLVPRGRWTHDFVHSEFQGRLVYRRKLYASGFRAVLSDAFEIRADPDYTHRQISSREATELLRSARTLVRAVEKEIQ